MGSEIQKTRPCVVISPDEMNAHLRTVIVAPMPTGSRPAAFRVPLTFQGKQGRIGSLLMKILGHHSRTVEAGRRDCEVAVA